LLQTATDATAIAASDHDPRQFGLIFDRHFANIHRYLHRRVGLDLADDLASETFVVAFRRRADFDAAQGSARPWLFGIATNLVRHHRRTERRKLGAYARTGVDPVAVDAAFDSADDRLQADVAKPILAKALAGLNRKDRDVLLLHAWAELTYPEIARALAIPTGTVRSRLNRARRRLREPLAAIAQVNDTSTDLGGSHDE